MDIEDERKNEIIALESIYFNNFNLITLEPFAKFSIEVRSEDYDKYLDNGLSCRLLFTHTEKYPEELPIIEVVNVENFQSNELIDYLIEQAKENLGVVMTFTLVSLAQEWLNEKWDIVLQNTKNLENLEKEREEEAEKKKFEGTHVSVATFLEWKQKFDKELEKKRNLTEKNHSGNFDAKKLTGKELFIRDKSLINSDLEFMEDVKIDETLFEDLDDLELLSDSNDGNSCYSSSDDSDTS